MASIQDLINSELLNISEVKTLSFSENWDRFLNKTTKNFDLIKKNYFLANLLEIYRKNKWGNLKQKELISKMSDNKLLNSKYVNKSINALLEKNSYIFQTKN